MPYRDRESKRTSQRAWCAGRRAEFVAGQVCSECGSGEGLELHHRGRGAKVSHRIWSWARPRLLAELAKCVWLCGDCHDRLHAVERRAEALLRWPHGTAQRYGLGCKCEACRAAHARSNRIYRLRRRLAMTVAIESWLAVVQRGDEDHEQETELVTLRGVSAEQGANATIELTDGTRITLVEPAAA